MKWFPYLLLLTSVTGESSCSSPGKPAPPRETLRQVSFATGGCIDSCHFVALRVDSLRTYHYYRHSEGRKGSARQPPQGYFTARVPPAFWDTLRAYVGRIPLPRAEGADLTHRFGGDGTGLPAELLLQTENRRIHLSWCRGDAPPAVTALERWLSESYRHVALQPAADPLPFETRLQYPAAPPPFPKLK